MACQTASLVVIAREAPAASCPVVDALSLRRSGSLAVYPDAGKLKVVSASERGGARLWSP